MKDVELQDSYKSILEAFIHAGAYNDVKIETISIHSEFMNDNTEIIKSLDGILVAPGFGERGIQGKIEAVKYAREHQIPFFGICLGMQMAIIEFARNVLNLENANSTEMDENTPHPVIDIMDDQKKIVDKGGTMRLGAWDCELREDSKLAEIYQSQNISERHRHRYEVNNNYINRLEENGMICSGKNKETNLVETIELKDHPFFLGVQFHPEYKSTVASPHPLFLAFVEAAKKFNVEKE